MKTDRPTNYAFIDKLILTQIVRKFPAFYETRRFITMFKKANH